MRYCDHSSLHHDLGKNKKLVEKLIVVLKEIVSKDMDVFVLVYSVPSDMIDMCILNKGTV